MSNKLLFVFLMCFTKHFAQHQFTIEVNDSYENATAFLVVIDDYNKSSILLAENIIQESKVDSLGNVKFSGNFLESSNKFYKIYIDNCNSDITDSSHLLNNCGESNTILFIAKNTDTINLPLNNMNQMFCEMEFSRTINMAIHKIDSLQDVLLSDLITSRNDLQRKIIYENYFKEIQNFSKSFDEPLAELYAFHLYSKDASISRKFYLEDLKSNSYYDDLNFNLIENYPNSTYVKIYEEDLARDNYKRSRDIPLFIVSVLGVLLIVSISLNLFLVRKNRIKKSTVNYVEVLSPQERKVFELMNKNFSNKEIAEKLYVSLSTIKTHINNIYSKLSITSRKDIAQFF